MEEILINEEYITLSQFLKMTNFISSGGAAKFFLKEQTVTLNNEVETRRGKKLYPNDIIKIENQEFIIVNEN